MSKPNRRIVRMAQFKAQITEQVLPEDSRVLVDLGNGDVVSIKIPILLDEDDDFLDRLKASSTEEEFALVILDGYEAASAEEQWASWRTAGYTGRDLMEVFTVERAGAEERLKAFRYRS